MEAAGYYTEVLDRLGLAEGIGRRPVGRGGRQVSITWRYNSGVNANYGQTVLKRYPLKSYVFCLLS